MSESYGNIKQPCTLYETIHALCVSKGVTDSRMCTDIGISRGIMSDLKTGRKSGVSAKTLNKIADYFGVSMSYLLGTERAFTSDGKSADLVEVIRHLCRQSGLSLTKLEAVLGFGNGTIGRWKTASPTYGKLTAVADYFGVSVEYLTAEKEKAATSEGSGHSHISEEIANIIDALPDSTQEQALRLIRYIYGEKEAD